MPVRLTHLLFACAALPAIILLSLVVPAMGEAFAFLSPARLPVTAAQLNVAAVPLLCCILIDRRPTPRLVETLSITIALYATGLMTLKFAVSLQPGSLEFAPTVIFAGTTAVAAAAIVLGARRAGLRPGIATAVMLALYACPPALFYYSAEISRAPVIVLQSASPSWVYTTGTDAPWGLVALGIVGAAIAISHEFRLRRRAKRMQAGE